MPGPSPATNTSIFDPPATGADRPVLTPALVSAGLWRAWKLGLSILAVFVGLALFYVTVLRHPPYVATAVIEPPISSGPQLSGASQMLASLAGVESNAGSAQFTKYLQVIGSTRFAEEMDRQHGVMRMLVSGWDPRTQSWTPPQGALADFKAKIKQLLGMPGWTPPDASSLAETLQSMTTIALVPGRSPLDLRSQVFSVSVRAKNREQALNLLTWTLRTADYIVRQDQLARTINRIAYLKQQIDATQEVYLRQSLQQILMSQEETLMTLQADKYYALDVVDTPSVSDKPVGTSGTAILFMAAAAGGLVYVLVVAFLLSRRLRNPRQGDPLRTPFPNPIGMAVGRLKTAFR